MIFVNTVTYTRVCVVCVYVCVYVCVCVYLCYCVCVPVLLCVHEMTYLLNGTYVGVVQLNLNFICVLA